MSNAENTGDGTVCRMTIYDLVPRPGGVTLGNGTTRFLYAESGNFSIRSTEGAMNLSTDDGRFATGETRIEGEGTLWICEVAPPDRPLIAREELWLNLGDAA